MARERTVEEWVNVNPSRVQNTTRVLFAPLMTRLYRPSYTGLENIPQTGPALLCANHATWFDGTLYALPLPRPARWMGKREALGWPIVGPYLRAGGIFPVVRRGADRQAMEIAEAILADGQLMFVYPEGTRGGGKPGLRPPRSGAARLALATGVPVIPVASYGMRISDYPTRAQARTWRRRVEVHIGEPLQFGPEEPTTENVPEVRDRIWAEVERLFDAARQRHAERLAEASG